jgi:hypothetical protein
MTTDEREMAEFQQQLAEKLAHQAAHPGYEPRRYQLTCGHGWERVGHACNHNECISERAASNLRANIILTRKERDVLQREKEGRL